jgi:hypothetical protein
MTKWLIFASKRVHSGQNIMFFLKTILSFLRDKEYRQLLLLTLALLLCGMFVYHWLEGWSYLDSIYFSVITLTTIGYGDFSPKTDAGKWFTMFYIIIGVGIILAFINTLYEHYNHTKQGQDRERNTGK